MSQIVSPLPGYVATVHVAAGDQVRSGDVVITLQSMKMDILVAAEADGTVAEILVNEGDEIDTGSLLVRIS